MTHVQPVLFQEHKCNQEHMPNEGTSKSTCTICNEYFGYSKPYYNCFDPEYILYKAWISFQAQHPGLATKQHQEWSYICTILIWIWWSTLNTFNLNLEGFPPPPQYCTIFTILHTRTSAWARSPVSTIQHTFSTSPMSTANQSIPYISSNLATNTKHLYLPLSSSSDYSQTIKPAHAANIKH